MSPYEDYIKALKDLDVARTAALRLISIIGSINTDIHHNLAALLHESYGVGVPKARSIPNGNKHSLGDWPSPEAMKDTLLAWHFAFEKMRAAWGALPSDERAALKEPPSVMHPR